MWWQHTPPNYHQHPLYVYPGTQGADQALAFLNESTPHPRPWGMVFNTDPIDKAGQHWLVLYAPEKSDRIDIMDSFGSESLSTYGPEVQALLKKVNVIAHPCMQSERTYVCGHYCLAYLYARTKGKTLKEFVRLFSQGEKKENDFKVCQFVCKVMVTPQLRASLNLGRIGPLGNPNQCCCCKKDFKQ